MKNLFKVLVVIICFSALPAISNAAVYEGGPVKWPSYFASDVPFLVTYKINGLDQSSEYYIKARLEDSSGKYSGLNYNYASKKWLKQTDSWASFPTIKDEAGTSGGNLIIKLPQAMQGTYGLQIAVRKVGSSVTELVQGKVSVQALDTSQSGDGGFINGFISIDDPNGLTIEVLGDGSVYSYYLSEDNLVDDSGEQMPGNFFLPAPADKLQQVIVRNNVGQMVAYSDKYEIAAGEIKHIELVNAMPLTVQIDSPQQDQIFSLITDGGLNCEFNIAGGIPPYSVSGLVYNLTSGETRAIPLFATAGPGVLPLENLRSGQYMLLIDASDSFGQTSQKQIGFMIDSEPPTGHIDLPLFFNKTELMVDVSYLDNLSGIKAIKIGIGTEAQWQEPDPRILLQIPDVDGLYAVKFSIKDFAGNEADYVYYITLDRSAPQKPEAKGNLKFINAATARTFLVKLKCEPDSYNQVIFRDATGESISFPIIANADGVATSKVDLSKLADGKIQYSVTSSDMAGNESSQSTYVIYKDTTRPRLGVLSHNTKNNGSNINQIIVTLKAVISDNSVKSKTLIEGLTSNGVASKYEFFTKNNRVLIKRLSFASNVSQLKLVVSDEAGNRSIKKVNLKKNG